MKSAWDKIFQSDSPLTAEEQEQALRELAEAVTGVAKVQASPEHERIKKQISVEMAQSQHTP
jgi:predicted S18 family serine protease